MIIGGAGGGPSGGSSTVLPASALGIEVPQGDPGALEATASQLQSASGAMQHVASILRGNGTLAGWQGRAEASYTLAASLQASAATTAAGQLAAGAGALQRAASELAAVQQQVGQDLLDAEDAQRRIDQANKQIADAQGRITDYGAKLAVADAAMIASSILPNHPGAAAAKTARDQAQQGINQAESDLQRAQTQLQHAEDDLKRAQHRAAQANQQWHTEAQAAAAALHAAMQAPPSLLNPFATPTPFTGGPGLPPGVPPVFIGAPLTGKTSRGQQPGLLDPANALGGANTLATAATLPFAVNAGYQLWSSIQARTGGIATVPERFSQTVGPLAEMYDNGEVPLSTVKTASQSFFADQKAAMDGLSADVAKAREAFAAGGIPLKVAAPLGGLAVAGDVTTLLDPHASTADHIASGANAAGTLMTLAPGAAELAGINAGADWIPGVGQGVALASAVYLGGDWVYQNVPAVRTAVHATEHFLGHDVPNALGGAASDVGDGVSAAWHWAFG